MRLKALVWIVRPGPNGPQVLLLERPEHRAGGEHPVTGKAEPGESPAAAAEREAFEETGLRGELLDLGYAHRYRGRRGEFEEHAFLLRVSPGATPVLSDEHSGYRWASEEAARTAIGWHAHARTLDLALKGF